MSAFLGKPEQYLRLGTHRGAGQESQRKARLPEGTAPGSKMPRLAGLRKGGKKGREQRRRRRQQRG